MLKRWHTCRSTTCQDIVSMTGPTEYMRIKCVIFEATEAVSLSVEPVWLHTIFDGDIDRILHAGDTTARIREHVDQGPVKTKFVAAVSARDCTGDKCWQDFYEAD
jgi:hypothetical protein